MPFDSQKSTTGSGAGRRQCGSLFGSFTVFQKVAVSRYSGAKRGLPSSGSRVFQ